MNAHYISGRILRFVDKASAFYRFQYWKKRSSKRAEQCGLLTKEQTKEIDNLFNRYHSINYNSHRFYTSKTGEFLSSYIPDEIWYAYIEPYFNPRSKAKVLDSKILYSRLLMGGGRRWNKTPSLYCLLY